MVWLLLWGAAGAGIFMAGWQADRRFTAYLQGGSPSAEMVDRLLPDHVRFFVHDPNFRQNWPRVRSSPLYRALQNISIFKDTLAAWNLDGETESSFEKWLLKGWGPAVTVAWSEERQALYILSAVGNREESLRWLEQIASSYWAREMKWQLRRLDQQWCLESTQPLASSSRLYAQLCPIHGVAVLAISPNPDPLREILHREVSARGGLLQSPGFSEFRGWSTQTPAQLHGFAHALPRAGSNGKARLEWGLSIGDNGKSHLHFRFPVTAVATASGGDSQVEKLAQLRQPDDLLAIVAACNDLEALRSECMRHFPSAWTAPLEGLNRDNLLGSFRPIWDPVISGTGDHLFIGLGEAEYVSEKYRVPFPRTIIAMPFQETAPFLQALEATVYRLNRSAAANLTIRKVVRPYGEYYEIHMAPTAWRERYGIRELPVFAFAEGLAIISSNSASMEKLLQHMANHPGTTSASLSPGVVFQVNMRRAPNTVKILLGALGLLDPGGENIFLSPEAMRSLNEVYAVMEAFGDSQLVFSSEPGYARIEARLNP